MLGRALALTLRGHRKLVVENLAPRLAPPRWTRRSAPRVHGPPTSVGRSACSCVRWRPKRPLRQTERRIREDDQLPCRAAGRALLDLGAHVSTIAAFVVEHAKRRGHNEIEPAAVVQHCVRLRGTHDARSVPRSTGCKPDVSGLTYGPVNVEIEMNGGRGCHDLDEGPPAMPRTG